ncbi:hypothetical protein [Variovorax terrae]|uniref:Twin-arginine translocation pathway signal protein n=1 Tax=Variovorax terrae TaxID=2923278 RepID=A0A9X1VRN6_9BURK|nr:hypothetical protein [Variovorax terrae]MCJ0761700.1 hypothetical protein [Variovorax terrae]
MQRRSLLKLGMASAVVLAVAGGTVALLQPGLQQGRLSEAGRGVCAGLGRALLDGSLPSEAAAQQAALSGLLERIDALTLALPPHAQAELSQLLALLSTAAGRRGMAGLSDDWSSASVPDIQQALQSMRFSSLGLRQQAYQALHDIVGAAYFSDASTWSLLGYPGPQKI